MQREKANSLLLYATNENSFRSRPVNTFLLFCKNVICGTLTFISSWWQPLSPYFAIWFVKWDPVGQIIVGGGLHVPHSFSSLCVCLCVCCPVDVLHTVATNFVMYTKFMREATKTLDPLVPVIYMSICEQSRELGSDDDGKWVEKHVDARCELTGMQLSASDGYLNPLLLVDVHFALGLVSQATYGCHLWWAEVFSTAQDCRLQTWG